MVAVKAHQFGNLLKSNERGYSAYLLFGSDPGMISERAGQIARTLAESENPQGEIVRIDEVDVEANPDRLGIELLMMPMFGGRKIVRVETGRRVNAAMLKPLVEDKALAGVLIVEAGNLKKDDSLRQAFERAPHAAAVACYGDDARDLDEIITATLKPYKIGMSPAARQLLISRLGADRVMTRGEIEKLALYAQGQSEITEDDVDAIAGDAAELTIDRIVNAAASGEGPRAVTELQRALSAGENGQGIILAVQRHFTRLHRMRAAVDKGKPVEAVIEEIRPPVHFKQKPLLAQQCRTWNAEALEAALAGIAVTARTARAASAIDDLLAERLILTVARLARGSR